MTTGRHSAHPPGRPLVLMIVFTVVLCAAAFLLNEILGPGGGGPAPPQVPEGALGPETKGAPGPSVPPSAALPAKPLPAVPAASGNQDAAAGPAVGIPSAPTLSPPRLDTAGVLDSVARALEQGDLEKALGLIESALARDPDNEALWLSKAGVCVRLQRYNLAWFALHKVRDPALRNSYYYFLEGEIHYAEERLHLAIDSYRRSLELEGNEIVERRLEKALREYEAQEAFRVMRSEHFTLSFADRRIEPVARTILDGLESYYDAFSRDFGVASIGTVIVILYPEVDFRRVTDAPDWAGGIYDGKIRVPVKGATPGDRRLEGVLKHELVHALVHVKCPSGCPRWLNEGLAQVYEGVSLEERLRGIEASQPSWRQALLRGFQANEDPRLFYARSLAVTRYLVDREGTYKVMELLAALSRLQDEQLAFREVFHRDREQLFDDWRAWAERTLPH